MPNEKTVYIIGAGASRAVGLPLQSELLHQIFTFLPDKIDLSSFLDLNINSVEQLVLHYYDNFNKQRKKLAEFVINNFGSYSQKAEFKATDITEKELVIEESNRAFKIACDINVTLEDLFTLFDKIIIGHEHFRIYSPKEIIEIQNALKQCIIFVLSYKSATNNNTDDAYDVFAKKLINERLAVSQKEDNLSVITMNWDSVLERKLYHMCEIQNKQRKMKILPDLCFYDYCYNSIEKRIVSTHVKTKGYYNIKILKLHGSINWLVCPYCGRVFVDYTNDIAINVFSSDCVCPYCLKETGNVETAPKINNIIITPTFLKDLNNLHIKNIWHNAFIDLTEATKLIFIGYSFPDADFEIRCLLKKAVHPGTPIEVVLHSFDNPELYREELKKHRFSKKKIELFVSKLNLPEFRYTSFFGVDSIKFVYDGLERFLQDSERE